ncbi:MAG: M23 family metallopeptidase, partial [Actinomycetota bacterium]|nr:M23 family metallopeptidase [Actinomycetota bacterium]
LTHSVSFSVPQAVEPIFGQQFTEFPLATVAVNQQEPIVIGPPLEGPGWLDGSSCCVVTPHRGAINPINGQLHAPERFAIDYVQLDDTGRFFTGPVDELSSYHFFGANILAVGDGPIVSMRWDLPEQVPGANPSGLALEEYGGNHIVQDLGDGHYAFYAHLQPGNPLGVEVGQQLERGEVIALLGNTGNTDSPHLHFHIMDSPLPLASNGLPFRIDEFEYEGRVVSEADLLAAFGTGGPLPLDTGEAGPRKAQSPLFLDVMGYPE